jgi:adenylate cyclase
MNTNKTYGLGLALGCALVVSILFLTSALESLELKSLDLRFHWFAKPQNADTNIVITAIDEKSLLQFKHGGVVWKWPREFYGALVRYLHRGGAKAVVFDVLYPDPDIDRTNTNGEESDSTFGRAMKESGNVVLASLFHRSDDPLWEDNPLLYRPWYTVRQPYDTVVVQPVPFASLPIPLFQQTAAALGSADYREDVDGVYRRCPLFYRYQNTIVPQLGVAAYLVANKVENIRAEKGLIQIGEKRVKIDDKGQFLISWYGKGGPGGTFPYYSIGALLASARDEEMQRTPLVSSSTFKDKIVFVGSNAAGLFDLRNTPFTAYEPYPGVEISATILSNLLHDHFLRRVPSYVTVLAILILSLFVGGSFFYMKSPKIAVAISVFLLAAWNITVLLLFQHSNLWLDWIAPMFAIAVTFMVAAVVSYQTEGKARRQLRKAFGGYLSPAVVEHVIEKQDEVKLGGEEIEATVLFTDLKDFTSISEKMSPPQVIEMLNNYFSVASRTILDRGGLVDKYIGDSIMAVFGAPLPMENHAVAACQAALEIGRMQSAGAPGGTPSVQTRIGINSGKMVVGNVGSSDRHDYTAIGDTVNLGSRLEGCNKMYGTQIIVSESIVKRIPDTFLMRPLDVLRVKGKKQSVSIYELMGERSTADAMTLEIADKFGQGIDLYRKRAFKDAMKVFRQVLKISPDDGPSKVYVERCQELMKSPPPRRWDMVQTLLTK